MNWDRDEMKREEVTQLEQCSDCYGHGTLTTPSKHGAYRRVNCGKCHGTGYVRKEAGDHTKERAE